MTRIAAYQYRVKNLTGELNRMARAVNFVWNYCNDAQRHAVGWGKRWPSGFALTYLTAGAGRMLQIPADTVSQVCHQYAKSRIQHKKRWLRYRGRKSLGWIPFRADQLRSIGADFRFAGKLYRVFNSRPLPDGAIIKDGGSFARDARGRWHLNIVVELPDAPALPFTAPVGIDLGLKDLATLSTGEKISNPRHFRALEQRLGIAQRARKMRTASKLQAKIIHARKDHLHKASRRIVSQFDFIAVGNVNAAGLAKTSMAKSVLDASWTSFRNMLRYKAIGRGGVYEEVDERLTTQLCSACGCTTGPKGVAELGIRAWDCSACGASHDRDVNSAVNILLRSGHRALVEGAASCAEMPGARTEDRNG